MDLFSGRVLLGAAYYPEYEHTRATVDKDLDLMVAAGIGLIRVGESSWSTWEPSNGNFEVDWLQPTLDGAHARGISVLLGTPTYAIPPWLQVLHPELAAERSAGVRIPWGSRQEVDFVSPTFRFFAERVIRAVVSRYASHPAVVGFQLDNEPGLELFHNDEVFALFVDTLAERYGTVERLNEAWGLSYWSHRLGDWSELWRPDGNSFPEYDLAWRRFQAGLTTEFISWQARVVRELARPDQFVTTCISYSRPAIEDLRVTAALDVAAGNPYHDAQDGLTLDRSAGDAPSWASSGVEGLLRQADRLWSSRQSSFLITETNAQSIGGSAHNFPPYPGQLYQVALAQVARGARAIEYWQWHTLHGGYEEYWGGVIPHSEKPGRVYAEVQRIGDTFAKLESLLDGFEPDADLTMVWSSDSKWALEFFPFLQRTDGTPDASCYERTFDAFYGAAIRAGAQVRILHLEQLERLSAEDLVRAHPVLLVPAAYVMTARQLELLAGYAASGGHLLVGTRTGYADEDARARAVVAPPVLSDPAGVSYEEFSNLARPLPVVAGPGLRLRDGAEATGWLDGLISKDADVLAGYDHPEFDRFAAVTTRQLGGGRVTYVGTVPNSVFAEDLIRWAIPEPISTRAIAKHPRDVTVLSGRTSSGTRVWFLHNWSPNAIDVVLGVAGFDPVTGKNLPVDDSLPLDRWSAIIVVEGHPASSLANPKGTQ